ncbi:hypothetical protein MHB63_02895 [Bacillus sp. FSL H8-0547]
MKKLSALFVVAAALLSGGCSLEANAVPKDVKSDIQKEFGRDIYVPEFDEYPVVYAEVFYPPAEIKNGKKDLELTYASEIGELEKEEKKSPDSADSKLFYGPYSGEPKFRLTYSSYKLDLDKDESRVVDGENVQYNKLEDKFLLVSFNAEGGSYSFEFLLSSDFSEEDALDVIEEVIKHTEEK